MNPIDTARRLQQRPGSLRHPEQIMLAAFGVFCFVYPFAILLLSFDWMPFGMEWMSSLLLAMLGVASWAWLWVNFGKLGLGLGGVLFMLGLALEYVGVGTGMPFGRYRYTGVLVPGLPGGVPLAIGFAWQLIVVSGLFTAFKLFGSRALANRWAACVLGALLAVGLDLLLEPVAYHVKRYWEWLDLEGGYYGVPWSNFATWFVAALVMNLVVLALLKVQGDLRWPWLPLVLYAMNVVMFGIVNVAHGFWLAGLVALLLAVVVAPTLRQRSHRSGSQPSPLGR
ncbi:MAG TPA: carotenoid biosynthesis protein [Chloroflexia bacterium]|nr:carotenoid biosynthesis protein [Chloroflexia bacterium]